MVLRAFQGACRNKVLYFHENQLEYPKRKEDDEWDFHFAWIQCTRLRCAAMPRCALTQCKPVLSCLVADRVAFNSAWNRGECSEGCTWLQYVTHVGSVHSDSFLSNLDTFVRRIPDKTQRILV